jgi:hypothetical protein
MQFLSLPETLKKGLKHGFSTRGPAGCIKRSVATFINRLYITKITQKFRQLGTPLSHVRPANQPALSVVAFCHTKI